MAVPTLRPGSHLTFFSAFCIPSDHFNRRNMGLSRVPGNRCMNNPSPSLPYLPTVVEYGWQPRPASLKAPMPSVQGGWASWVLTPSLVHHPVTGRAVRGWRAVLARSLGMRVPPGKAAAAHLKPAAGRWASLWPHHKFLRWLPVCCYCLRNSMGKHRGPCLLWILFANFSMGNTALPRPVSLLLPGWRFPNGSFPNDAQTKTRWWRVMHHSCLSLPGHSC